MKIEDHYGDLQSVYFQSKTGDLIIDSNKKVGFIKKHSDRIYVDENGCLKDLYNWVNQNQQSVKLKIYRINLLETSANNLNYEEIEGLIQKQKLEPIISI